MFVSKHAYLMYECIIRYTFQAYRTFFITTYLYHYILLQNINSENN